MKKSTISFIALVLFIAGCSSQPPSEVPAEQFCTTDADCVANECCHATSCVAKGYQQDCAAVLCSASCQPGTLDCNQGSCGCVNNRCIAQIG